MRDVAVRVGRVGAGARNRRTTLLGVMLALFLMLLLAAEPAFAAPANDNFADSPVLAEGMTEYGTTYGQTVQATNSGATREVGEPAFGFYNDSPYKTVWYEWTAPADGRMNLYDLSEGCGQYLNASVGVYTGGALGSLTKVTQVTEYCNGGAGVRFDAQKGTTYHIQVGSPFSFEYGTFRFGWSFDRFDSDEDGVLDGDDSCPYEAATTASGCPEADLKLGAISMEPDPATVGKVLRLEAYPENFGPNTATDVSFYTSFPKGTAVLVPQEGCYSGTDYTGKNTYVDCLKPDMTSDYMGTWIIDLIPTKAGEFTLPYAEILSSTVRDPDQSNNIRNDVGTVTVQPSTDTTKPTGKSLAATASASGTGAALNTNLTATFSEEMRPDTLNTSSFKLYQCPSKTSALGDCTKQITNVAVTPSTEDRLKATLDPFGTSATKLKANTKYKVVATTAIKDMAGNVLDQNPNMAGNQPKNWTFTTGSS